MNNWEQQAMCAGDDPRKWELLDMQGGRGWDSAAASACAGCAVMAECAAAAIEPLAVGTVRGGVWIPSSAIAPNKPGRAMAAAARERLQAVAAHA